MSKLKAFNCVDNDLQEFCEPRLVYLKSDADKVIAELEEKLDTTKNLLNKALDCISNCKNHMMSLDRKNNHANYKRCLAMAEMCNAMYDKEDANVNGCGASWEYISEEMKYWERWHKRWLEIADKFK